MEITLATIVPESYKNGGFSFTPELSHLEYVSNYEATQLNPGNLETIAWTEGPPINGINEEGNKIMGISESGTLATYASIHPEYTWSIPESWTFEEAATVPL